MVWAPPSCWPLSTEGMRCQSSDLIVITELETIMERTVIAIDIAKKVFQLHWVDADTGCIERLQLKRAKLLEWFSNRVASHVVMEACGGAHDWARTLSGCGHDVRLISPRKVRPFVQRNKTDAADAHGVRTTGARSYCHGMPCHASRAEWDGMDKACQRTRLGLSLARRQAFSNCAATLSRRRACCARSSGAHPRCIPDHRLTVELVANATRTSCAIASPSARQGKPSTATGVTEN